MWHALGILLTVLVLAGPAYAQSNSDEFYSGGGQGASQGPSNAAGESCQQQLKTESDQERQAKSDFNQALTGCGHDTACQEPVVRTFDARMNQLHAGLSDIHTNCTIRQMRDSFNSSHLSPTPCELQIEAENEQEKEAQNEFNKALIYCWHDANCQKPAAEKFDARMQQLHAELAESHSGCRPNPPQIASNPPPGAPNGSSPTATSPDNMHPSGASPAAQNNARGVSSLPTEVDPFGRIEASVPPEEEPGGTGLGSASGTSPNNGSGSNPGTLSGGVGENAPVAAGSPTGHPPGIPPFIAEVPTLAPVPGAAAPLKPLIGSVSKTVSAGPSPGNSPGVPHIPPSIVNGPSYNPRPLQKRITAAANPPGTGASGAQPGPQPQPASRNPFTGALRGVRLFADWIASRWPGGPSGLKAASKASNELKRPYEEQWTKPYGGIQQVGDTFAMHGAGKVAKTVLRAGATKLAQSDAGRKLLQQLAAAAGALGAGGKKLVGSVETASVESAGSAAARKVSTSAAKKLLQKAAIDRKQFLGFWSKGGSVWSSTAAEKRKWATAFKQGERLKLNGYRPYGASVKSLNLNGKSIRTLEQDLPKRGFKRFDDVVRDSNGKPIPGDDGKPVKQIIFVHPDGGMVRIKPYGQPGSPSLLRKTEPHAVKAVMKPGSALTDYNKLDHEYFKVDNQGNPWPAFPNDVSAEAWNLYKDGWAEVVHSFVTP